MSDPLNGKRWDVLTGDCLELMASLPDGCVDAVVTDPPYGLSFMGKKWDCQVPAVEIWQEALRVLKPGGHLLAFAGTRTQHRMAVRIEDAGFEIRDMIAWVYGSGFPKSHNLKGDWEGWGTALKPALEPITVARKPFRGTVAQNVAEYSTGAMNIDGCRIAADGEVVTDDGRRVDLKRGACAEGYDRSNATMFRTGKPAIRGGPSNSQGRWPANLIHDGSEEVVGLFPETGPSSGRARCTNARPEQVAKGAEPDRVSFGHEDNGGSAARFYYCAKAGKSEREEGLSGAILHAPSQKYGLGAVEGNAKKPAACTAMEPRGNHHPTVKPVDLMRYLCRLVTPPNGLVLDPFAGSGTTGVACAREGMRFLGMEMDSSYADISRRRIADAYAQGKLDFGGSE